MADNYDYDQTITSNEMETITDSIHDYLESMGSHYQLKNQRGAEIGLGEIRFKNGHYDVELLSSFDDEDVHIGHMFVEKETQQLYGDFPGSHVVQMYDEGVDRVKEKYNIPLADFETELEDFATTLLDTKIIESEDEHIKLFSYKSLDSNLHYFSKMASLYADKLSEKSSELAYYSTSIINDLIEVRNIKEAINELDVDLKASPIPLNIHLNSKLLPALTEINIMSDLAKDFDAELWVKIFEINPDFKQKKENLERVLKYHDL